MSAVRMVAALRTRHRAPPSRGGTPTCAGRSGAPIGPGPTARPSASLSKEGPASCAGLRRAASLQRRTAPNHVPRITIQRHRRPRPPWTAAPPCGRSQPTLVGITPGCRRPEACPMASARTMDPSSWPRRPGIDLHGRVPRRCTSSLAQRGRRATRRAPTTSPETSRPAGRSSTRGCGRRHRRPDGLPTLPQCLPDSHSRWYNERTRSTGISLLA